MHIKFLPHGSGDPRRAAQYLTGALDHNGHVRAGVQVLRGNPTLVAEVAASTENVHKYTSGVIAWACEDAPKADEIDEVLRDFERVAFAGLDPEQYAWSAIQHISNDGSTHVHVFAARVELTTGKALNIAPPGWEETFDLLRDFWNFRKGWARPDDPNRARLLQPGRHTKVTRKVPPPADEARHLILEMGLDALDIETALACEPDPKRWIADLLMEEILAERINNREELVDCMRRFGEINRVSDQFISLRLPGTPKPIRFKGRLFEDSFDAKAIREEAAHSSDVAPARQVPDPAEAAVAKAKLARRVKARTDYNLRRYPFSARDVTDHDLKRNPPEGPLHGSLQDLPQAPVILVDPPYPITTSAPKEYLHHDRNASALVDQFEGILRAAGDAIDRTVGACLDAVRASGWARRTSDRAGDDAQRACDATVRAGGALDRMHRVLAAIARRLGSDID